VSKGLPVTVPHDLGLSSTLV